jgi:hypothetical protein
MIGLRSQVLAVLLVGLSWPKLLQCPETGWVYPLGIAIFKDAYTSGNIRNGTALNLIQSGTVMGCPGTGVNAWVFQPSSDFASNRYLNASFSTNGYWTKGDAYGNGSTFVHFSPGPYTVAAGDEWGNLMFLTFEVN